MDFLGWFFLGLLSGAILMPAAARRFNRMNSRSNRSTSIFELIRRHFLPTKLDEITISERRFPFRMRADLQNEIDRIFGEKTRIIHFCSVRKEYSFEGIELSACMVDSSHHPAVSIPPEYEEIDIGEQEPIRVLKTGLWLLEQDNARFAVLLAPTIQFGTLAGVQFQIAVPNTPAGTRIASEFFKALELSIAQAKSYRGKILSLDQAEQYSGQSTGITVHRLHAVNRAQVILPETTLDLLERNVIRFVAERKRLAAVGQPVKKGILFYGPPGTGKTHTIHYLAKALEEHTTLLISAEQVGLLAEYMSLARLLQPSMVIIEDVDLIARDRTTMASACEEVMLNKLLNEMDGLKQDAEILFILTTNRPEQLEAALASRPGRVDQAIEFPLPDEHGRRKLVVLYSHGVKLSDSVITETVRRTEGASAAFIKELMRRTVQFHAERDGAGEPDRQDVDNALQEMLFRGGSLNLSLLGAKEVVIRSEAGK